ncbi:hypothetical protein F3Y22_tig00111073pilonHSYRG00023 [Hibiscus syriacus]|uniref:Uncharacterized protein n=1 Tax=Hibiscus syriacus TaxID=106335 RepID=A0A6A2Z2U7_HIBSY|nr:hypothetical protein F3Y22_tig00111073pilonHSYRG00023 [Hibiscus syriacus]
MGVPCRGPQAFSEGEEDGKDVWKAMCLRGVLSANGGTCMGWGRRMEGDVTSRVFIDRAWPMHMRKTHAKGKTYGLPCIFEGLQRHRWLAGREG